MTNGAFMDSTPLTTVIYADSRVAKELGYVIQAIIHDDQGDRTANRQHCQDADVGFASLGTEAA